MNKDSFLLRVITPAGLQIEERVSQVILPAKDGEMGVLPAHVCYTGLLGAGILQYVPLFSDAVKKLVVTGGFCTFAEDTLSIVADSMDAAEDIDLEHCRQRKEELLSKMVGLSAHEPAWDVVTLEIARIEAVEALAKAAH